MIKAICKHCSNFEPDPTVNYCLCFPYPDPSNYNCRCADIDASVRVEDLVDCPDCIFSLDGIWCVKGFVGCKQSDCQFFQSCFI